MVKKFVDEIHLTNWKKHKNLSAKINGKHFVAAGPNGAGKTSVMQAISRLLGQMPKLPDEVATQGEPENANIQAVLVSNGDKYIIEEKFSKNKNTRNRLRFKKINAAGNSDELTPAGDRIKEIFGQVTDLTPLMALEGEKQFTFLQKAMNLDVEGFKLKRKYKFDDRRLVGREIKTIEAKLNAPEYHVPQADIDEYKEPKDYTKIQAKKVDIAPLREKLYNFESNKRLSQNLDQQIKNIDEQIKKFQQQKEKIAKQQSDLGDLSNEMFVKINGELADVETFNKEVENELNGVYLYNQKVQFISTFLKESQELTEKRAQHEKLSKEIAGIDNELQKRLAELPLNAVYDGLELRYTLDENNSPDDVGLYLNKLPFSRLQLSYSEMIKALIKLSCFLNPEGLNFIWIENWSLLDEQSQSDLLAFAEENENVQFGIEKVDNTKEIILDFIEHK